MFLALMHSIPNRIAYIPERKDLFPYMSAKEIIRFTACFYPNWSHDLESRYAIIFEIPLDRNTTFQGDAHQAPHTACNYPQCRASDPR